MLINKLRQKNIIGLRTLLYCCLTINIMMGVACSTVANKGVKSEHVFAPMNIAYLRLTQGYWQAWLTDIHGQQHQQLTTSAIDITRISWSPDHKQLLCNQNDGSVVSVNVADNTVTKIPMPVTGMFDAQWSPDGKKIGFSLSSSQNADNNEIWILSTEGQSLKKLTSQMGVAQSPSWHPNGQSIVYSQTEIDGNYELWRLQIDNGNTEQLSIGYGYKFDPSFNANGELAYTANSQGSYDIWRNNNSTGRIEQVTEHPAYDAQPSWSPDSKHIAFYSLRDGKRRIWVKNLATNNVWSITPDDAQSRYPVWVR